MEIIDVKNENDLIISNAIQSLQNALNIEDLNTKQLNVLNACDALNIVSKSLKKEVILKQNFKIDKSINSDAKSCFLCEKQNDKTEFFYSLILKDQVKDLCSVCCSSIEFGKK